MDHERYRHIHGNSGSSMNKASFEVALKGKKQIAEGTFAFIFEKPNGFHFKAGHHIRMTLINPSETDSKGNSRFFSIASTPQDLDLVIAMRIRDTAFKRILGRMQTGGKVLIEMLLESPHGSFALHDDSSKPAVFIIGGIGIIPAFSMIKDAIERKLPHKIFLFYSNRRPEDAPFLDELEVLAKQNPSFKLIATMTEPEKSSKSWHGETGHIDQSMLTKHMNNLQSPIYYIAGLPEMTSAVKTMLTDSGVNCDDIYAEELIGFNMNEIRNVPSHAWKRRILSVAIILTVIVMGILHVFAGTLISSVFSLKNPLLYLMIGLMLAVIPFKLKYLLTLIRSKKKNNHKNHSHHDRDHYEVNATDGAEQAICPVRNVPVNKKVAEEIGLKREYKGQKYYFCCSSCPPIFDENPESYIELLA